MGPKRPVKPTPKMRESIVTPRRNPEEPEKTEKESGKKRQRPRVDFDASTAQKTPKKSKGITIKEGQTATSKAATPATGKGKSVVEETTKQKPDRTAQQARYRNRDNVHDAQAAIARFYHFATREGDDPTTAQEKVLALYGFGVPLDVVQMYAAGETRTKFRQDPIAGTQGGSSKIPHKAMVKLPTPPGTANSSSYTSESSDKTPSLVKKTPSKSPSVHTPSVPQPSVSGHVSARGSQSQQGSRTPQGSTTSIPSFITKGMRARRTQNTTYLELVTRRENEAKITLPPRDFNVEPLGALTLRNYDSKSVLETVWADIRMLGEDMNVDLLPYFGAFESWLLIRLPYSTEVVKHFYANMQSLDDKVDSQGKLIEGQLKTSVRGQEILISPSTINECLEIQNPPRTEYPQRSDSEIHQILMPNSEVGPLPSLRPTDLPNFHKLIYYLYSRIMINKAQNYTHFTRQDHILLSSILAQDTWNAGDWIFDQLEKMHKRPKTRHLPFPTLVSLILKHNKIWYLDQKAHYIDPVSREKNLLRAGIFIPGIGEGRQEAGEEHEAESSAHTRRQTRSTRIPSEIPRGSQMDRLFEAINASRTHMDQKMTSLHQRLEEIDDHLGDSVAELKMHIQVLEYKLSSLQQPSHPPQPQPQAPKITTVIEVPSSSPLASLFPDFTTSEPTLYIPLLHPLSSTTHLTTPPIYVSTPLTPTTSQSQPTIPMSPPLTATPHTTVPPQDLNLPPSPTFVEPPEDSISFQRTLFEANELLDDASTFIDNDKKGEKKEEERAEAEDTRMDEEDVIIEEPRDPKDDALAIVPYVPPHSDPVIVISREIFLESLLSSSHDIPRLPEWKPETSDT